MEIKIGHFARIGQVTVQTLRHYDEVGLLRPSKVDALSGYRYYDLGQLPRLHRILALKDLGFSLEQIARLLEDDLPLSDLSSILRLKQEELRHQMDEGLERLEKIEARLRLLEQEGRPLDYEVIIKRVVPLWVASLRRRIPSYWEAGPLWGELFQRLQKAGVTANGTWLSLYHTGEPDIDAEACAPVPPSITEVKGLAIYELPGEESMASTIHRGSFTGLAGAYTALLKWIDAHGYRIYGPDREIYLRLPEISQSRSDLNAITEMQVPIERD